MREIRKRWSDFSHIGHLYGVFAKHDVIHTYWKLLQTFVRVCVCVYVCVCVSMYAKARSLRAIVSMMDVYVLESYDVFSHLDLVHCIEYGSVLEIGECVWERAQHTIWNDFKGNICLLSTIRNVIWLDRKWKFGISNTGDCLIRTVTDTNGSLYINEITIYVIWPCFFFWPWS